MAEAVAQIDGPLVGVSQRPSPHPLDDVLEDVGPLVVLRVEGREVLRQPLAQPLLVVVLPADRLSPPLMRDLVSEEEGREAGEDRRIGLPGDDGARLPGQLVVHQGEIGGAVPARQAAVSQGHRHRRVRDVSEDGRVEGGDVRGALGRLVDVAGAARRAVGADREGAVEDAPLGLRGRGPGRGVVKPDLADR